ncbi:MAG TPA: caspase family protein [Pyrinomonadaceae bacterium]
MVKALHLFNPARGCIMFRLLRRATAVIAIAVCCLFWAESTSQVSTAVPPELVIQTGHSSRVNCAVFGPNGRWLATGAADNSIRLWDTESGLELRALHGHSNWIRSLAVSRGGELLASGSNDRTIKIWSVSSGRELVTLTGHTAPIESLLFMPDDKLIVSGSADQTIKVWDAGSGRLAQTLSGDTAAVGALAVSGDGKYLASGGADGSIKIWEATTWKELRTLSRHTKKITALAFSPDSKRLLSGSADGMLTLWHVADGKDRNLATGNQSSVLAFSFTPGDEFISVHANGGIVSWDVISGKPKRTASSQQDVEELLFAALSADGKLTAVSTGSRIVEIRRTTDGELGRTLTSRSAGFFAVAFSRDGRWLASGTNDRTIRLWQLATGRELPKLTGHTGWVKAVAFSPDSRLLASASNSGEIKLWDPNTGREVFHKAYPDERFHTLAFSRDGKWLAAAGTGQTIRLLDVSKKESRNLTGHTGEITSIVFASYSTVLSGSTDKTIRLWDVASSSVVKTLGPFADDVNAVAVSPDGSTLAFGMADKKIALFDLASAGTNQTRTLSGHTGEVFSLAFSADGRWLASGGIDQSVRIWDSKTGAQTHILVGGTGEVNGLSFSTDSRSLVSANGDGSMIVWQVETGSPSAFMVSVPDTNDWLVATPGGLFDGSPRAWKFLLWRFAQDTFRVAPVESYFNEFYYPGLLADVLANNNPRPKQDITSRDRRQPQIRVESGQRGVVSERNVQLRLEIAEAPDDAEHQTSSGARDLRLFRNGLLVQSWLGDVLNGSRKRTIETTVPIVAGANEFTAYAFNRDNVKSADAGLTLNGAETLRRIGTAYLVVVGVSRYTNSQYNLNYSVADATAIGEQLRNQQEVLRRYHPVEVVPLLNEEATKANILLALKLLAGTEKNPPGSAPAALRKLKPAHPEDAVVFYFSGHGTAQGDRFYLIPHDLGYLGSRAKLDEAGLARIVSHSVSDLELEEALRPVDADQLLFIVDACNSGQVLQSEEERRGPMNTRGLAQLAYEKGMYVLTASQSDEVAFESAGLKHSYLAYALVEEGIKSGAADSDRNGEVFLKEWFDYATERVPRIFTDKPRAGKELEEVDADEKRVQRPRVFNMREGGAERFMIAKLASR